MGEHDPILAYAREAIASGIDDFLDLLDVCLDDTDLEGAAVAEGNDPDLFLFALLEDDPAVHVRDDDFLIRLDLFADGLVFTHRLSEAEVEGHVVALVPDLVLLDLGSERLVADDGRPIELEFPPDSEAGPFDEGALVGPEGWLSAFSGDDLVAFRRVGDSVVVEAVAEAGPHGEVADVLGDEMEHAWAEAEGVGVEVEDLLRAVVLEEAGEDLFRTPTAPVTELLAEAGLRLDRAWVGPIDEDWDPPSVVFDRDMRADLAERHQLRPCCVESLDVVIDAWTAFTLGEDVDFREANDALEHGVSDALWDHQSRLYGADITSVEEFASQLIGAARSGRAGSAHHLRSLARETRGATLEAEEDLKAAIRAAPDYAPALVDLATYASDRGDAAGAVSLMRRAGVDEDHPMLRFHLSLGGDVDVGRNQPCPCGSGRKYKQCHIGRPVVGPGDQIRWLVAKLANFVTGPSARHRLLGLASTAMWAGADAEQMARLAGDEWIIFLAAFEGGGVEEFLAERGVLLPEVERDLLELWTMATLGLWEVVETDGESHSTLLDTRTGERVEVTDHSSAATFTPGEQVLARPIEGLGRTWLVGANLKITARHRDSLISLLDSDPGAADFAAWYGAIHAPPIITNREGEGIHAITGVLRPTIPWERLTAFLDDTYERAEDGHWQEMLAIDDDERIVRAELRRRGDELVVEVDSWERLDRVVETLDDRVEVDDVDVADPRDPSSPDEGPAGPELDDEVISQLQERMESRWLDEEVPALGGLTPRQAADDPTRRQDLIDLLRSLDEWDTPGGAFSFRPDELREELGIGPDEA